MEFKDFKELYAFLRGKFIEIEPKEYVEPSEKEEKPKRTRKKKEE
jgi:hypothetical protein